MDLNSLPYNYHNKQSDRIAIIRKRIADQVNNVNSGRVIPTDNDLAIGSGRRLQATVMFLDICGFSKRMSNTAEEQELLLRILNFFFTEMIRIVEDYGGTVEKNTGDGLLAYFTNSGRGEDSRQCALAAALTMFYATNEFIDPVLRNTYVEPISFRISMDYGGVTIARIGAARRFHSIVAVGATANFASKMLALADPNSIVIGESILKGLPVNWVNSYVVPSSLQTGWINSVSGQPYKLYNYQGRWRKQNYEYR